MTKNEKFTKIVAKVALALGVIASIAANVISAEATALGRVVAAWPAVALLIAVHLIQHSHRSWIVKIAISGVAGVAAWVSYWHMVEVVLMAGEGVFTAHILPASVDGLLYLATVVLTTKPKPARPVRRPAAKAAPRKSAAGKPPTLTRVV